MEFNVSGNILLVLVILVVHEFLHALPVWIYNREMVGHFGFLGIGAYYKPPEDTPLLIGWISIALPYLLLAVPVAMMVGEIDWKMMVSSDFGESFAATVIWGHIVGGIPDLLISLRVANIIMVASWAYVMTTQFGQIIDFF